MKRIFFVGMAFTIASFGIAFGQSNPGKNYTDDVYYRPSQAQQDVHQEAGSSSATSQQAQEDNQQQGTEYYNSSGASNDGYSQGGNNQDYTQNAYGNNGYDDYDDYGSRIRRFYYPMSGMSYWGGLYDPFWSYPYYGMGYRPGFSFSLGWSPYWGGLGWNSWYGGGFGWGGYGYYPYYSPFYSPYYGYGWGGGYGMGYWNGYYMGLYHGGYYGEGNPYVRNYNYAPRGARDSRAVRNVGNYGSTSRTMPVDRSSNTVRPENARVSTEAPSGAGVRRQVNADAERNSRIHLGNTRVYDNNATGRNNSSQVIETNRGGNYRATPQSPQLNRRQVPVRNNSRLNNRFNNSNYQQVSPTPSGSRNNTPPMRNYQQTSPARSNYTPSRSPSYTPPARSSSSIRSTGGSSRATSGRSATRR